MSAIDDMWSEFAAAVGVDAAYTAWGFGDPGRPDQVSQLGLLVRDGPKRATAGLLSDYDEEGEPLPSVGDYSIVLDGSGEPLCIILTTEVRVAAFGDVDDQFAWDEGEGDRTLAWWRQAHQGFFRSQGATVDDATQLVLERFDLVWPVAGDVPGAQVAGP